MKDPLVTIVSADLCNSYITLNYADMFNDGLAYKVIECRVYDAWCNELKNKLEWLK